MQSFKNQLKAFFNFNKRQERGAFVLIVLIIIAFAVDLLLPKIIKEKTCNFSSTISEIEAWKATAVEKKSQKSFYAVAEKTIKPEIIQLNPVSFNPNKFPREKWLEIGLPESVVNTILKYESKGGSFRKPEDLQKIYGLSSNMYEQIKDYVLIPVTKIYTNSNKAIIDSTEIKFKAVTSLKTGTSLDVNRADSVDFLEVPGIGPFYAGQIVSYRNRLGGYNSIEQLRELYKMDSSRFRSILPCLTFKDTILNKIDVNTADFTTVLKHPYVDYETTKKIFNHRNKLGRYAGLYQLKSDSIISDSLFKKLAPYLKVD